MSVQVTHTDRAKECSGSSEGLEITERVLLKYADKGIEKIKRKPLVRWVINNDHFCKLKKFLTNPDVLDLLEGLGSVRIKKKIKKKYEEWVGREMTSWEHLLLTFLLHALVTFVV